MPSLALKCLASAMTCLMLAACAGGSPSTRLVEDHIETSTRSNFTFCSNYGCSVRWTMGLSTLEWDRVRAYFAPPAADAAAERAQIAQAIGEIERITGRKAGTDIDKPGAAIIAMHSLKGQHDCIDEAHNTTVYLTFMERDGLLKWHSVGEPAHRGMIIDRWFHNTATVIEKNTGAAYVIDSWFGANGEPSDVTTLENWMDGWEPEKFKTRADR
ncbi:MAG: hypothetical protein ACE363_00010 [Alphaproteobacteria bacterium]